MMIRIFNFSGVWHSIVVYFGCLLLWQSDPAFFDSGITLDYWSFGTLIYHAVIFIVSIKVFHNSQFLLKSFLSMVVFAVGYRISLLDSAIHFFYSDIRNRIHRPYIPLFWSCLVSTSINE